MNTINDLFYIGKYLYCNRHQFVLWVQVDQTETRCNFQRFTIIHPSGQSIQSLEVTDEYSLSVWERRMEKRSVAGIKRKHKFVQNVSFI